MQENGAPRQPEHIGILALEVYVPPTYVRLTTYNLTYSAHKAVTITSMQTSSSVILIGTFMNGIRISFHHLARAAAHSVGCDSATGASQVSQEELEAHDGVAAGRYTAGLGQVRNPEMLAGYHGQRMLRVFFAHWTLARLSLHVPATMSQSPQGRPICLHRLAAAQLIRSSQLKINLRLRRRRCPSARTARMWCRWP